MTDHIPFNVFAIAGNEALQYDMFVRLYGTRERINDVTNPRYTPIGDIMLPRESMIHYQQHQPAEVGPTNNSPFISNFDKRINIFFNLKHEVVLGSIRNYPVQFSAVTKAYEGSHFIYQRTRNYPSVINKPSELLINNLAIGELPIVYTRRTVFTPFQQSYNRLYTLIDSINEFSKFNRHQFVEFQLPRTFPTFKVLDLAFEQYKKFFNADGQIVKYERRTLQHFQAEQSFWLLDLYGILMGYGAEQFSQFNRLNDDSRRQLEIIFTYGGKCWIVNLKNLINLIGYSDKPGDAKPSTLKVNYFKRFYLNLISLVSPINEAVVSAEEETETVEETDESDRHSPVSGTKKHEQKTQGVPVIDPPVDDNSGPSSLADLYARPKRNDPVPDNTQRDSGKAPDPETHQQPADGPEEEGESSDESAWGQDVSDDLFEKVTVESATVAPSRTVTPTSAIERELRELSKTGQITTREAEYYANAANSYLDIEIGGRTLAEIADVKPEEMKLKDTPVSPDSITVRDKAALRSRTQELRDGYISSGMLDRNILEMILHVQNGKVALTNLDRETIITADSKYDVYTMKFQPIKGSPSTRRIRIPKVEKDGTFTINGVRSYSQLMRMELPVRKITPTKVSLTSYYDKKVMVERSTMKVDDYSSWLRKSIIERSYADKSLKVSLGGFKAPKDEVCYYYSILAVRFSEISIGEFVFDFDTVKLVNGDRSLAKLCTADSWLIGFQGQSPILIDNAGLVTVDGAEKGYIEEILGLNTAKAPVPCATVNINGYKFPVIVVLCYWIGLSEVMKMLKVNYRTLDPNQRAMLAADEYLVNFADERMVLNRRDELSTLIMSGLRKLSGLHNFSRSDLDNPNVWFSLMGDPRVKPTHFKEMSMIFDMFIDPITARLLKEYKYPVVMDRLLVEAVKLMLSNESKHEIEISEQRLVGYERFSGHVYRELVKATRQYRNKPNNGKKTFDLNPEAVMMSIITDSSHQAAEEVNPVHQVKIGEEYTFGGTLGRSDQAMVRRTRGQLPNNAGIVSEAGKDSGKVGFIGYLTADAKITDLYGNVDVKQKGSTVGRGSVVMNLLYGTTKDDTKRTMFSGVQQSQVMAADNYEMNPLRTTYDSVLAYRTSELYSSVTKKAGKVVEISAYGMTVEYEDGTTDKFALGYEVGKGAGEYHKHEKITDRAVGYQFEAGEILAFDQVFFARDPIDPRRVVWKSGGNARIALWEDQFTFEDSIAISKSFAEKSTSPFLKPNEFTVEAHQSLKLHVKVGDEVEYDQILCDIQNPESAGFDFDDAEEFVGLDRLGIKQIKAKQSGVITKIEVVYNGDPEGWDESLRSFIKRQDGVRGKIAAYKELTAPTGDVGGNTSIGKSKLYPETAVVIIYIDNKIKTTTADKFVVGNQMKGTVGFIYEHPIYTVDGRPVDIIFSLKSLLNRMVLSLRDKLVANEVNNVYTARMISKYGRY